MASERSHAACQTKVVRLYASHKDSMASSSGADRDAPALLLLVEPNCIVGLSAFLQIHDTTGSAQYAVQPLGLLLFVVFCQNDDAEGVDRVRVLRDTPAAVEPGLWFRVQSSSSLRRSPSSVTKSFKLGDSP